MDIRRLSLWEGRDATYMSNGSFFVVTEDQGEITLELSVRNGQGARVSPLCLPYFRGTGSGVMSDENGEWWRMRQGLYQAGGMYFSFPSSKDDHITTSNTYWSVKRYGTEDEFGGVWKYSEMKSREEGNRYKVGKVDLVIPGHNVIYMAYSITNLGDTVLRGNPQWTAVLSSPLVEKGTYINTNAKKFNVFPVAFRESGVNRFVPNTVFSDLRKAPLLKGGTADASIVPSPTGTYDYIIGRLSDDPISWISATNPNDQMTFMLYTQKEQNSDEFSMPFCTIGQNWYGRMDAPWALFDGATPQVKSLSLGFTYGESGSSNVALNPGETKTCYMAALFSYVDNQRLASLGFFTNETKPEGFMLKRTKSTFLCEADTAFKALRKVSKRLFFRAQNGGEDQ